MMIVLRNTSNMLKLRKIYPFWRYTAKNVLLSKYEYAFSIASKGASKLTSKDIQNSNYEQLITKISKLYNYNEYKVPSTLALLEIHHQYNIFKPGDCILDIGAGPLWSWTNLALKLTHTSDSKQKVISVDYKMYTGMDCQNNIIITGNFMHQPIRTKIAIHLLNTQLDTILIDATSQYTGNQQQDALHGLLVYIEALKFSTKFLKKGGTIIFKTVQSALSLQNEKKAQFFFNQVYQYRSSCFRVDSPTYFYILRGYMMTDNITGLQQFLKEYKKTKNTNTKIQIVEKYRALYKWDPVQQLNNQVKDRVMVLKNEGRKNKQIVCMYENDPFIKINRILNGIDKMFDTKANPLDRAHARSQMLLGANHKQNPNQTKFPKTKQQFIQAIYQEMQKNQRQAQQKQKAKKQKKDICDGRKKVQSSNQKIKDKAPLSDNEIYMKSTKVKPGNQSTVDLTQKRYLVQDLYGFHPDNPYQSINKIPSKSQKEQLQQNQAQLQKIFKSFSGIKQAFQKNTQNPQQKQADKMAQDMFGLKQVKSKRAYKFTKNQKVNEQQDDQDFNVGDEDEQDLNSQSLQKMQKKLGNRTRNYKKAGQNSQFDFEQSQKSIQKNENEYYEQQKFVEQDKEHKIQYLRQKPRKTERQINQKISKRPTNQSYFKTKNKNNY